MGNLIHSRSLHIIKKPTKCRSCSAITSKKFNKKSHVHRAKPQTTHVLSLLRNDLLCVEWSYIYDIRYFFICRLWISSGTL